MISDTLAAARAALLRWQSSDPPVEWEVADGWRHLRAVLAEHDLVGAERDAYRAQVSDLLARVEAQSEEIAALAREGNRWRVLLARVAAANSASQHEDACDADFRENDAAHAAIKAVLAAHPPEKP